MAEALAAKIGKRPRRSRRKSHAAALPEPPSARWRRRWRVRLEAAVHKIAVAGKWLHAVWIVSIVALVLAFAMMAIAGLLVFIAWWLSTWRRERLRPALIFLTEHAPWLMIASGAGLSAYLEDRFKWPTLLAFATTMVLMFAICIPWWRWVYPAIEHALLRVSQGALRAGVVLVVAMTVLAAAGVWACVYAR